MPRNSYVTHVASCNEPRLATQRSVVQITTSALYLIFYTERFCTIKVFKNSLKHQRRMWRTSVCRCVAGTVLVIQVCVYVQVHSSFGRLGGQGLGCRCVSSLTWRMGLRPIWMRAGKDVRWTGTEARRALYRSEHTGVPARVARRSVSPVSR